MAQPDVRPVSSSWRLASGHSEIQGVRRADFQARAFNARPGRNPGATMSLVRLAIPGLAGYAAQVQRHASYCSRGAPGWLPRAKPLGDLRLLPTATYHYFPTWQ